MILPANYYLIFMIFQIIFPRIIVIIVCVFNLIFGYSQFTLQKLVDFQCFTSKIRYVCLRLWLVHVFDDIKTIFLHDVHNVVIFIEEIDFQIINLLSIFFSIQPFDNIQYNSIWEQKFNTFFSCICSGLKHY